MSSPSRCFYPRAMSAAIAFGTGKVPEDLATYGAWARLAEDCGFSMITAGDSQSLWADPFVTLAVAAHQTDDALLATTVTNRDLSTTGEAEWEGRRLHMRWGPAPVPVWIAAEGPRPQFMADKETWMRTFAQTIAPVFCR